MQGTASARRRDDADDEPERPGVRVVAVDPAAGSPPLQSSPSVQLGSDLHSAMLRNNRLNLERYTYALREFNPDTLMIRTLACVQYFNGGSSSSGESSTGEPLVCPEVMESAGGALGTTAEASEPAKRKRRRRRKP